MPTSPPPRKRLSLWGYVILNAAAALFLLGIFAFANSRMIGSRGLPAIGAGPPLLLIWLCFVAASVYDAFFDRLAEGGSRPGLKRRGRDGAGRPGSSS